MIIRPGLYLRYPLAFIMMLLAAMNVSSQTVWKQTGGPEGGLVRGVAVSPNGTVFASGLTTLSRSTDNGASWSRSGSWEGACTAFAVTSQGIVFAASVEGIFRSPDDGMSWLKLYFPTTTSTITHIAASPNGTIYAVAGPRLIRSVDLGVTWEEMCSGLFQTILFKSDGVMFASNYNAVMRSTDLGWTWTVVKQGFDPASDFVHGIGLNVRGDLFTDTDDGMYITHDNGDTWVRNNLGPKFTAFTVSSNGIIIAGNEELYRSANNGATWENAGLSGPITVAPAADGSIFVGTKTGIYRAPDTSNIWVPVRTGLINSGILSLACSNDGVVIAGESGSGVQRSDDTSFTDWHVATTICTPTFVAATRKGTFIAGSSGGAMFRSQNKGASWAITDLPSSFYGFRSIAVSPTDSLLFAIFTGGGIAKSSDDGLTWTTVSSGINAPDKLESVCRMYDGTLIAGTFHGSLWRSEDAGMSWTEVISDLAYEEATTLTATPGGLLFAVTADGGVYRSTDRGTVWKQSNTGLPGLRVSGFAVVSDTAIYAGLSQSGVFGSTDGGLTWADANTGMPTLNVLSLATTNKGDLLAGTASQGVFRLDLPNPKPIGGSGVSQEDWSPESSALVLPNPLSGSGSIQFSLKTSRTVQLTVSDNLGRSLIVLPPARFSQGHHSIPLDMQACDNGVYHFVLHLDRTIRTGIIVLQK